LSRINYEVSEKFAEFGDFLLNIKQEFAANNNSIHKARNELKIIRHNDIDLVVKSFKVPNMLNKVIYSYIRDSKAKRSFVNAVKICSFGLKTPEPVGYIEYHKNGLIEESYFVSLMYENDFVMRKPLDDKELEGRNELLKSFAEFTFNLHEKNVYHLDYSAGNILVKKTDVSYDFAITDINRMNFRPLTQEEKLKSFQKLWIDEETLDLLMRHYASLAGWNPDESVKKSTEYLLSFKKVVRARNKLRKIRKKLK
jgi:tRNA A-37 threonylcarbamoyl transferase component Bud32